jgi:hypothetical protein
MTLKLGFSFAPTGLSTFLLPSVARADAVGYCSIVACGGWMKSRCRAEL